MKIQLSDHFTYGRILRFVIPSILMIICTSIYGIVDGFFISNFAGKEPFAAVNLIMPVIMAAGAIGFMVGTGGSAVVSTALGEGKKKEAGRYFSMLIYVAFIVGCVMAVIGFFTVRPVSVFLGATEGLIDYCVVYGRICFLFMPAFILQYALMSFFAVAEKPTLSLFVSIAAGIINGVLDYVFIDIFKWGVAGAALATGAGQIVGGIIPLIYFIYKKDLPINLVKTGFDFKVIKKAMGNGASEMVTNLATSVVSMVYNFQLMKMFGENGVAAYGIIMYESIIFMALFFGYSMGSAPIVSYHYGAANTDELKNLFRKSIVILFATGIVIFGLSELTAPLLVKIFAGKDKELFDVTLMGFRMYSISFIIMGFSVWGSSFFTALNNGVVSAVLSFLKTMVFEVASVIILPFILGKNGIWLSISLAELMALMLTAFFIVRNRKKYHYI